MPDAHKRYAPNEPRPGRLTTRRVGELRFIPQAAAVGRVRVRSRVASVVIVRAAAHGRVRVRSQSVAGFPQQYIMVTTGQVYVAPVGTPGPTGVESALNVAFQEVGYVSDEGATFRDDWEVEPKSSWSSLYPKEFVMTQRKVTMAFALREYNKRAIEFAMGVSITTNAAEWKTVAPNHEGILRALVVDVQDIGDSKSKIRYYFPKGVVSADVDSRYTRTTSADLPVVFGASQTTDAPYVIYRSV